MNRVIRGNIGKKRRKKILKYTKGCFGSHSKIFTTANQQYMKSKSYSYSDRRKKKTNYRKLWIIRINSNSREKGLKYKTMIKEIKEKSINLNKKIISTLTLLDKDVINKIINVKIYKDK
ncbi:MAG: 50S ribosomal protein L20 [Gammaproteobacteria bacterium]